MANTFKPVNGDEIWYVYVEGNSDFGSIKVTNRIYQDSSQPKPCTYHGRNVFRTKSEAQERAEAMRKMSEVIFGL
ncbi:MAG: hypothetical protein ACRCZZ_06810 [Phocaeicola sp.]